MKYWINDHSISVLEKVQQGLSLITRPPRAEYSLEDLSDIVYHMQKDPIHRIPVNFKDRRGIELVGSLYAAIDYCEGTSQECVIYCHGNSGSQTEGRFMVKYLAPNGISVFCFDFAGCGHSQGEIVTLGYFEKDQIIDTVNFLKCSFNLEKFILWGRSMGAASILLGARFCVPSVKGIILDSPYSSVDDLMKEIAKKIGCPSLLINSAVHIAKAKAKSDSNVNIAEFTPINEALYTDIPLLLGHAINDSFIDFEESVNIFEAYYCKIKRLVTLDGDHNSIRDPFWIDLAIKFIFKHLDKQPFSPINVTPVWNHDQHFRSFTEMLQGHL